MSPFYLGPVGPLEAVMVDGNEFQVRSLGKTPVAARSSSDSPTPSDEDPRVRSSVSGSQTASAAEGSTLAQRWDGVGRGSRPRPAGATS